MAHTTGGNGFLHVRRISPTVGTVEQAELTGLMACRTWFNCSGTEFCQFIYNRCICTKTLHGAYHWRRWISSCQTCFAQSPTVGTVEQAGLKGLMSCRTWFNCS